MQHGPVSAIIPTHPEPISMEWEHVFEGLLAIRDYRRHIRPGVKCSDKAHSRIRYNLLRAWTGILSWAGENCKLLEDSKSAVWVFIGRDGVLARAARFVDLYARRMPTNFRDADDFKNYCWKWPVYPSHGELAIDTRADLDERDRVVSIAALDQSVEWRQAPSLGGSREKLPNLTDELKGLISEAGKWEQTAIDARDYVDTSRHDQSLSEPLTKMELAKALIMSRTTLDRQISEGIAPVVATGRKFQIRLEALELVQREAYDRILLAKRKRLPRTQ